ncbi:MAG TPA: 4-hydroxythreonine-4-phosphate dehydrogenase PdxA [Pyrinomonadaceae bacterium]|nr:4-hydroxythreonine-4-phosphate dehydrogenase PdxA [Pyrinomonadaceae bacterium]
MSEEKPTIGVTIGDAAGIGPEITLKAISDKTNRAMCRVVLIGDAGHMRRLAAKLGVALDDIEIVDLNNLPTEFEIGVDAAVTGKASAEYIEKAVELWREGKIDAICTAPISKKAIALGGYNYPGHTEFIAELTDTTDFRMSFFADKLRVVLLSTHLPLTKAIERVKTAALVDLISFANREISKLLGRDITIAVAGLNPHASEGGMFGSEEHDEIIPAIEKCKSAGINVSGPYSPDTIFGRCASGEFDAVVALYHDQATIAVKSLAFGSGVNVTLGLPLIRTSVDHGTAYDIAGKGIADESSLIAAIKLAADLANQSRKPASI